MGDDGPLQPSRHQQGMEELLSLSQALRSRSAWTASYRQEFIPAGMEKGETASGSVWIAWPDRALFVTGEPAQRTMALAGRTVRLIDLELGTCEEHRLDDQEWERIPLVAVLDPGHALDHFRVSLHGRNRLVMEPREAGGVARVEVVAEPSGLPAEVTVVDIQGAVNHLWFTGWAPTADPPGGRWMPKAPEGVTCQSSDGRTAPH